MFRDISDGAVEGAGTVSKQNFARLENTSPQSSSILIHHLTYIATWAQADDVPRGVAIKSVVALYLLIVTS